MRAGLVGNASMTVGANNDLVFINDQIIVEKDDMYIAWAYAGFVKRVAQLFFRV